MNISEQKTIKSVAHVTLNMCMQSITEQFSLLELVNTPESLKTLAFWKKDLHNLTTISN